jgi:exonuclease III
MRRPRSVFPCARVGVSLVALTVAIAGITTDAAAQANFKVAFLNIQSGKGEPGLAGHATPFADTANCTDTTQPLNAWGVGFVQRMLANEIGSDPSIVALGLAESWLAVCGSPENVRKALGWKARSDVKNGLAIVARYGFAGPVTFLQLDTSLSTDTEQRFIGHAPVCLDSACTASYDVFVAHWAAAGTYKTDIYERLAKQSVAFMQTQAGARPRTMLGDLNMYDTSVPCASSPMSASVFDVLRNAGYVDTWRALHGSAEGFTGMTNRAGCGSPEGYTYKRIDYAWTFDQTAISMKRFAMAPPGDPAPSDHYGIVVEYPPSGTPPADEPPPVDEPPTVSITSPAAGATVSGVVAVSAAASDDRGVTRVEFVADGALVGTDTAAPFEASWDTRVLTNGSHSLQARAYDTAGNAVSTALRTVTVANTISAVKEVVVYAASARVAGTWRMVADSTAAGGKRVWNPNLGTAKATGALASPASYVDITFTADKGTSYRLWIRGKAESDSWANDSVYVQFNDSLDTTGAAMWRIGTTSATSYQLEDGLNAGLRGWGWQDNGYGTFGPLIRFATTGTHTVRIQNREDGLSIDQVVLSAEKYLVAAPGATKSDTTILPLSGSGGSLPSSSPADVVLYASRAKVVGDWKIAADASAASAALVRIANLARPKLSSALATPASYAELTFTAESGLPYRLWIRGKAEGDSWANDSAYIQFSDSIDDGGAAVWRIGSTSATTYQVEDGSGAGLKGWGWQDNGYGSLGALVRFATTGTHTLRIQNREDGLSIDQVVLSPGKYLTTAPGATKNDTTILIP